MKARFVINVTEDVYLYIKSHGRFGESMSCVLARLLGLAKMEETKNTKVEKEKK